MWPHLAQAWLWYWVLVIVVSVPLTMGLVLRAERRRMDAIFALAETDLLPRIPPMHPRARAPELHGWSDGRIEVVLPDPTFGPFTSTPTARRARVDPRMEAILGRPPPLPVASASDTFGLPVEVTRAFCNVRGLPCARPEICRRNRCSPALIDLLARNP